MNNEEKIISLLTSIDKSLKSIAADVHPVVKKEVWGGTGLTMDEKKVILSSIPKKITFVDTPLSFEEV